MDRALDALAMHRNHSAAIGGVGVTAIKLTTLKLYSTTITFIPLWQYYHSYVDSDMSFDVFFVRTGILR